MIHTHTMQYYSAQKRWNLAICYNMDGPWGYYPKWNKSEGERQILYDFTHMWNIKNQKQNKLTNQTKQKQTYRYREQSSGTSLAVQWFRLCPSNAGGVGLIPGWGTKIPCAMWHGKKNFF